MNLTKKDLKEIKDVVVEATEPYFTAIKEDFNNVDNNFQEISRRFDKVDGELNEVKTKLSSLERRIIALEDMATEHGKELRKIRAILAQLKKQKKVNEEKIVLLEKRITRVEAMVA